MRTAGRTNRRWMSLAEVIVAVALSGVALASGLRVLFVVMYGEQVVARRTTATSIAKCRMEEVRNRGYSALSTMAEERVRVNEAGVPDADGFYYRTTTVLAPYYQSREIEVDVSVAWRPNRLPVSVKVATIVFNRAAVGGG